MTASIYFGFVFTMSIVLLSTICAPTYPDAVDLQMNVDELTPYAGNSNNHLLSHKYSQNKRDYPTEGILLGKREYPTEGILLGKREYPTEGILLGKREYPTEGILLGKRNFRFFAPQTRGESKHN